MKTNKMRNILVIIVIIAMLISGCGGGKATAAPISLTATLSEVTGTVNVKNPGDDDFSAASNDSMLEVRGQIVTDEDGRARLNFSTGVNNWNIQLDPNVRYTLSAIELQPGGQLLTKIKLEAGRLWIALQGGSMEVETPSGIAAVRGSNLMVWVEPATQNVYVNCFEGNCSAENSAQSLSLSTGYGTVLYHVGTGANPPPPESFRLTWADFEDWAKNNPDVQNILPSIIETLTAIPPFTPTPTATATATSTSTPTATAQTCFTLTSPKNGAVLPAVGEETFSWTPMPGAAKYEITFTAPDSTTYKKTLLVSTYYFDDIGSLYSEGKYTWKVAAYDAAGKLLCTAPEFTFKKPVSPTPTFTPSPTPINTPIGMGDAVFSSEYGPTGNLTCTYWDTLLAKVTDPNGVRDVSAYYQSSGGSSGSFPLTEGSAEWTGMFDLTIFAEQTVTWHFGAIDNLGNFEVSPNSFQFTCVP